MTNKESEITYRSKKAKTYITHSAGTTCQSILAMSFRSSMAGCAERDGEANCSASFSPDCASASDREATLVSFKKPITDRNSGSDSRGERDVGGKKKLGKSFRDQEGGYWETSGAAAIGVTPTRRGNKHLLGWMEWWSRPRFYSWLVWGERCRSCLTGQLINTQYW